MEKPEKLFSPQSGPRALPTSAPEPPKARFRQSKANWTFKGTQSRGSKANWTSKGLLNGRSRADLTSKGSQTHRSMANLTSQGPQNRRSMANLTSKVLRKRRSIAPKPSKGYKTSVLPAVQCQLACQGNQQTKTSSKRWYKTIGATKRGLVN